MTRNRGMGEWSGRLYFYFLTSLYTLKYAKFSVCDTLRLSRSRHFQKCCVFAHCVGKIPSCRICKDAKTFASAQLWCTLAICGDFILLFCFSLMEGTPRGKTLLTMGESMNRSGSRDEFTNTPFNPIILGCCIYTLHSGWSYLGVLFVHFLLNSHNCVFYLHSSFWMVILGYPIYTILSR